MKSTRKDIKYDSLRIKRNETRHISFGKIEPRDDDEIAPYKKEDEFQNETLLDFLANEDKKEN